MEEEGTAVYWLPTPCCKKHDTQHTEDAWTDPPLWSQLNTTLPHLSPENRLTLSPFSMLKPFILSLLYESFVLRASESFPSYHLHPPFCLWQCACLYCNHVAAIDRCWLCFLFPNDRNERKGETSDWSLRPPSLNSLTLLYHTTNLFLVRTQTESTSLRL